jgi:hypothetical protein
MVDRGWNIIAVVKVVSTWEGPDTLTARLSISVSVNSTLLPGYTPNF